MDEEEKPHSPPQLLPNDDEHFRRNRIIANLKDSLLSQLAESNPPSPSKLAMFPLLFSSVSRRCFLLSTPYAPSLCIGSSFPLLFSKFSIFFILFIECLIFFGIQMIIMNMAISNLNENKGSTEEESSNFIVKEYKDLPWPHKKILGIQLEKLCQDEEIVCNEGGR
ncbi:hypothetical protein Ahy_A01g001823 [Arachis hypogaea]|uniref:Uncharacterized protein n=1 Tax=Arachis hypogaea TaxID=3818 RepID=A0A445EPL4_ARAHY|nr:hypothetical protein Ahy_A01g001823 [Arachis hypogaea]